MKITRRELAISALAGAASAQTPPNPPSEGDELDQARKQIERYSRALIDRDVPMDAEPAFLFKA